VAAQMTGRQCCQHYHSHHSNELPDFFVAFDQKM